MSRLGKRIIRSARRTRLRLEARIPNKETAAAIREFERGGGKVYRGTSEEAIKEMIEDEQHQNTD